MSKFEEEYLQRTYGVGSLESVADVYGDADIRNAEAVITAHRTELAAASEEAARVARLADIEIIRKEAALYPTSVFPEPDGERVYSSDCYTASGARLLAKNAISEIEAATAHPTHSRAGRGGGEQ